MGGGGGDGGVGGGMGGGGVVLSPQYHPCIMDVPGRCMNIKCGILNIKQTIMICFNSGRQGFPNWRV